MEKNPRVYLEDIPAALADLDSAVSEPVCIVEQPMARQYRLHILYLPGEAQPTWHKAFSDVIAMLQNADYEKCSIIVDGERHELILNQES